MRKILTGLFLTFAFIACQNDKKSEEARQINYFDIQTYFKEKATSLTKKNPLINKTITVNKEVENKRLKIVDWKQELSLFINSDINKIAWKNSYSKDSISFKVVYIAKEKDLKTRKIIINYDNQKNVNQIYICNQTDNLLLKGKEELIFIPLKGYEIKKYQKVILLGEKTYLIKGVF